ncbi:MAG: hypothetical protein WA816_07480 [Bacteroidales bacterium]
MKSKTIIKDKKDTDNQQVSEFSGNSAAFIKKTTTNPVYVELVEEGKEDFYNYLEWLGLAKKPDLLILTSSHHFYFEVDDLKNVKVVVNLNKLNNIKSIREFLQAIYNVLPHKCYFIGNFTDSKKQNGYLTSRKSLHQIEMKEYISESDEGPWSSFLNMLYGIIDSKTNRYMSDKSVKLLLDEARLKILDMTEFNGYTYFCTQKVNSSVE